MSKTDSQPDTKISAVFRGDMLAVADKIRRRMSGLAAATGVTCKGSIALGTACMRCQRCLAEVEGHVFPAPFEAYEANNIPPSYGRREGK